MQFLTNFTRWCNFKPVWLTQHHHHSLTHELYLDRVLAKHTHVSFGQPILIWGTIYNKAAWPWELSWKFKQVIQSQCQTPPRFWCRKHLCKVATKCRQILMGYCIYNNNTPSSSSLMGWGVKRKWYKHFLMSIQLCYNRLWRSHESCRAQYFSDYLNPTHINISITSNNLYYISAA